MTSGIVSVDASGNAGASFHLHFIRHVIDRRLVSMDGKLLL